MILILLGTQQHKFKRLIKYTLQLVEEEGLTDNIIVQCGTNKYDEDEFRSVNNKTQVLFARYLNNYESSIKEANFIICHSGVGIIMDCLKYNKKIITVPRTANFNEHVDDHQKEIALELSQQNYLFMAENYDEFKRKFSMLKDHKFEIYKSNNDIFNIKINELIENI